MSIEIQFIQDFWKSCTINMSAEKKLYGCPGGDGKINEETGQDGFSLGNKRIEE